MRVETFARIGYLARAVTYFIIGGLALLVALGEPSGRTTDSKGALRKLFEQPFGEFLLILLAAGLFSYAIWRLFQCIKDYDHLGNDWKGIFKRTGHFFSAFTHAALGFYAINLVYAISPNSKGASEHTFAHWLLIQPYGRTIVFLIGAGIVVFGFSHLYRAYTETFCRHLKIPTHLNGIIIPVCKFGLVARGVVFALVGVFFVRAAVEFSSREAGGMKEAWRTLQHQPMGDFLVAIVAVGLIAFACYSLTESIYRRFD